MDASIIEEMFKVLIGFVIIAIAFACVVGWFVGNHGFHF